MYELYQTLSVGYPQLLQPFESIIVEVIKDIRTQQHEHARLESSFLREKEAHEAHLRRLEEDLDMHVLKIEDTIRKQVKKETGSSVLQRNCRLNGNMCRLGERPIGE